MGSALVAIHQVSWGNTLRKGLAFDGLLHGERLRPPLASYMCARTSHMHAGMCTCMHCMHAPLHINSSFVTSHTVTPHAHTGIAATVGEPSRWRISLKAGHRAVSPAKKNEPSGPCTCQLHHSVFIRSNGVLADQCWHGVAVTVTLHVSTPHSNDCHQSNSLTLSIPCSRNHSPSPRPTHHRGLLCLLSSRTEARSRWS